jgi:hypothetical protein
MAGWHELQLREASRHAPVAAKSAGTQMNLRAE